MKKIIMTLGILMMFLLVGCINVETKEIWHKNGLVDVTFRVESQYPNILDMVKQKFSEGDEFPEDVEITEGDDFIEVNRKVYELDNRTFESKWDFWNKIYTLKGTQNKLDEDTKDIEDNELLGDFAMPSVNTYVQVPCTVKEKKSCLLVKVDGEEWYKCTGEFMLVSSCWLNLI